VTKEAVTNPYGLEALWTQGDFVARGTLIIMVIMSMGSWYIIFTKVFEQSKLMRSAKLAGDSFWAAGSIKKGSDALDEASGCAGGGAAQRAAARRTANVIVQEV